MSSRFDTDQLVNELNGDPNRFDEAIELSINGQHPIAWRAAWILGHATAPYDPRLIPYISKFIKRIPDAVDGHQRELIKIIGKMQLNEDEEGAFFNQCMNIWEAVGKKPSTRIKAFEVIIKIAKKHPELKNEINFLTQEHYTSTLSPGIKNSFLNKLNSLK